MTFNEIQTEIAGMLSVPDEELTPEQKQSMDAYLEELGQLEEAKVDSFGQFLRLQSEIVAACKEEAKRLSAKAKAAENRLAWLKEHYTTTLRTNGLKKVSGRVYSISVRESESVAVTAQPGVLPPLYIRTKVTEEPDKPVIREALKAGIPVPGCELVKTYSLQVK